MRGLPCCKCPVTACLVSKSACVHAHPGAMHANQACIFKVHMQPNTREDLPWQEGGSLPPGCSDFHARQASQSVEMRFKVSRCSTRERHRSMGCREVHSVEASGLLLPGLTQTPCLASPLLSLCRDCRHPTPLPLLPPRISAQPEWPLAPLDTALCPRCCPPPCPCRLLPTL